MPGPDAADVPCTSQKELNLVASLVKIHWLIAVVHITVLIIIIIIISDNTGLQLTLISL